MYLKQNVKLAPYIWNWYAWSQLIPPHIAGTNIVERHIKIMESFVEYPEIHYEAINTNGMIGGPFINLEPNKQSQIKALLEKTKKDCSELIELNDAIKAFDAMLQKEASGGSLADYYQRLPSCLRGMVELTYDLHNHPQMQFIEPIIYQKYFNPNAQSIMLSEVLDDHRSFCLSTPYVDDENTLELKIPFSSSAIDALMKMRFQPGDIDNLIELLQIKKEDIPRFQNLFTTTPPKERDNEFDKSGIRIRYFGHACVLLQTKDISILIDPILGYNYDGERQDRLTYEDLPQEIDYVLITHNHQDHFLFEVLLQLRHRIKNIVVPSSNNGSLVDPSMKLILQSLGFSNITVVNQFDEILLNDFGKITMLPFYGEHGDLDIRSKLAYHLSLYNTTVMFLADSNCLDTALYDHIFNYIGSVDMLFIGMECVGAPLSWLYGPALTSPLNRAHDQSRRLSGSNYDRALEIVQKSGCKEVNVYAMGMEPWLGYMMAVDYKPDSLPIVDSNRLINYCHRNEISADRIYGKKEWLFPTGHYQSSTMTEETAGEMLNVI